MGYKLSQKSEKDFEDIYEYTHKNFGEKQADKYTDSLEECFSLLSETPTLGRHIDDIKKGFLRHEHQEHVIFYQIKLFSKNKDIFIVRILHGSMKPKRHL